MKKKSLMLLILLMVSLVSFGCSKSNTLSDKGEISTSNNSSQKSPQNIKSNRQNNNSEGNNSQVNNSDNNNNSQSNTQNNAQNNSQQNQTTNEDNSQKKNGQYVICIDPGHQAKGDMSQEPIGPGATQTKFKVSWGTQGVATKTPEYELTLSASKILKTYLEQMGFKVIMTRESNDVNITNAERATFANKNNADLVIRIHADGSEDSSVNGASLHIPAQNGQYTSKIYPKSNQCAEIMMSSMKGAGFKVNNIFQRSDLTGFNWSEVPAVLVEMGYMSNPEEDQKMAQKSYQEKMMKSIAEATQRYFSQN